jgi:hypothetical protein
MISGILFATLWPFNFFIRNEVSWLGDTNGIRFGQAGIVVAGAPLMAPGAELSRSWSLELLLRPENFDSVHTILGFYAPDNPRPFKVRQWTDGLLVSHNAVGPPNKVRIKFDVDHALQEGRLLFLTLASGPNGTIVYLNGKQTQVFPKFTISQNDLAGEIIIGTSPTEYETWPGEVRGLAIYSKELSPAEVLGHFHNCTDEGGANISDWEGAIAVYLFNERAGNEIHSSIISAPILNIPKRFRIPHKAFLKTPAKEFEASWGYVDDVLRNIAGFIPMGFLLCAFRNITRTRLRALLNTILAAALLSFTIEVLQFFILFRNSGITDIITNTSGAALGALFAISPMGQKILARKNPPTNPPHPELLV